MLTVRSKAVASEFRSEAARLMSVAARTTAAQAAQPPPEAEAVTDSRIHIAPPDRAPLAPDIASNQNRADLSHVRDETPFVQRAFRIGRLVARIVLSPLYVAVAIGSIGLDVVFLRSLLGL